MLRWIFNVSFLVKMILCKYTIWVLCRVLLKCALLRNCWPPFKNWHLKKKSNCNIKPLTWTFFSTEKFLKKSGELKPNHFLWTKKAVCGHGCILEATYAYLTLAVNLNSILTSFLLLKDARSVSLYPYNRSQILQLVKLTKLINIAKGIAKCLINNVFLGKK